MGSRTIQAKTFLLTQGTKSTTIWLARTPEKTTGFWKSEHPYSDFRDTGAHNQFIVRHACIVSLYNDIGLEDTVGQGHKTDFANAEGTSLVLTMTVALASVTTGMRGWARIGLIRSNIFTPGDPAIWEYKGLEVVPGWQTE
jgi:hypothetical protein